MSGNTFGTLFSVTSAGESHGAGYVGIVDGCPPGLAICEADLQRDLDRRKPGQSRHTTQRREPDEVRIMSGVFEGVTTGTPIGFVIENTDQKSKDYGAIKDKFRPGHADYAYLHKYGIRDYRGGGRSSARETCVRVAAAGIARKYLSERYGISIVGYLAQLGPVQLPCDDLTAIDSNPFFALPRPTSPHSKPSWTPCVKAAIPSAPVSTSSPVACRRAGVSRCLTGLMPTSPKP